MSTFNDYGGPDPNVDDSLGDVIYDTLEEEAKDEAVDKAKEVAGKALDKATDHIKPIKAVKDKIKNKAAGKAKKGAKKETKKAAEKAKDAAKKIAEKSVEAAKSIGSFLASNPVVAVVVIILILAILATIACSQDDDADTDTEVDTEVEDEEDDDDEEDEMDDDTELESPVFVDVGSLTDDEVVIILMSDCMDQQYDTMGELDADKEEMAKSIYSVFRSYGLNNASIAGMLGNLDIESGLDPSAIEGIFDEYGFLGTRKAAALLSLTNYTENTLFPSYKNSGLSINKNGYKVINDDGDTVYYCGMGLTQWTGGNAYTLLKAAETMGMNWYDMDFQLGYMMSDCMYRSGFFSDWVDDQDDDDGTEDVARDAALKFAHSYVGNSSNDSEREDAAEEWYEIIKDWDDSNVDEDYVDSVVSLATELGGLIEFIDVQNAQYRCLNGNVFDNSSIAAAAISFAWPTRDQSFNNGTNLYQVVHDAIFPQDYIYKACDRTVACAVRWSGSDDDYPRGSTADQLRHLESSSKWEKVGSASSLSMDDLQAGDIFCLNGHTFIYVTESAIEAAYTGEAESGSDSVSGSINKRSPGCDSSTTSIINRGGQDWEGRGIYNVYRCVDPDNSDTYSSIAAGVTN